MGKTTTRTDVKASEIVVASVMIGGAWLGLGGLLSGRLDTYVDFMICFVGYVITMGLAFNAMLKEFVEALES